MPSFATSLELLHRRRWVISSMLGVLAGLAMFAAHAQQAGSDSGMSAFLRMVPLGVESKGVVIPSFDENGRRASLITADVMRRIDSERLYAEKLTVQMFNADPSKDLRIDLKTAFYQMAGGILRSTERARVSRPDFEIEGDNLIFDTVKNQGRMTGNIRMVIFDTGTLSGEGKPPSEPKPAK
jgi:hypothetical protein